MARLHTKFSFYPGHSFSLLSKKSERLLSGARATGHLCEIAPGFFVAVDTITDAISRASALAQIVPPSFVIQGRSALWVYCGGEPPAQVSLLGPYTFAGAGRFAVQIGVIDKQVTTRLAGLRVHDCEQVAVDLARHFPSAIAFRELCRLLAGPGIDWGVIKNRTPLIRRLHGGQLALQRLQRLCPIEIVQ